MSEEDDIRRGLRTLAADPPPVGQLAAAAVRRARTARTWQRGVLVTAALVVVAGGVATVGAWRGGDQDTPLGVTPPSAVATVTQLATGDPATPDIGTAYPYQLFVHCGIRYARFADRWWETTPQQWVPPGPPGGDRNYVPGTMTLIRADRAQFRSTGPPLQVDFWLMAGDPPLCQ